MDNIDEVLEELISTIERNSFDNKATIGNVKLWAKSWRREAKELKSDLIHNVICFLVKTAIEENKWRVEDDNELGGDEASEMIDTFKDKISKELKVIGIDIANCI